MLAVLAVAIFNLHYTLHRLGVNLFIAKHKPSRVSLALAVGCVLALIPSFASAQGSIYEWEYDSQNLHFMTKNDSFEYTSGIVGDTRYEARVWGNGFVYRIDYNGGDHYPFKCTSPRCLIAIWTYTRTDIEFEPGSGGLNLSGSSAGLIQEYDPTPINAVSYSGVVLGIQVGAFLDTTMVKYPMLIGMALLFVRSFFFAIIGMQRDKQNELDTRNNEQTKPQGEKRKKGHSTIDANGDIHHYDGAD